jgi:hypothetical protein
MDHSGHRKCINSAIAREYLLSNPLCTLLAVQDEGEMKMNPYEETSSWRFLFTGSGT